MLKILTVLALLSGSASAAAAGCKVELGGNDAMQFDKKEIVVDAGCKDFTIQLKHSGKLARNLMGHNVVVAKSADLQGVAADGAAAGLDHDYVKPGDARVIAHTKVVGGGESTSVSFAADKLAAGGDYVFFCSFPGHWSVMKGTIRRN